MISKAYNKIAERFGLILLMYSYMNIFNIIPLLTYAYIPNQSQRKYIVSLLFANTNGNEIVNAMSNGVQLERKI